MDRRNSLHVVVLVATHGRKDHSDIGTGQEELQLSVDEGDKKSKLGNLTCFLPFSNAFTKQSSPRSSSS